MKLNENNISDDYCMQRAGEIVSDPDCNALVNMICKDNCISKTKKEKMAKRDLRELVFNYLTSPLEEMEQTSNRGMSKLKNKKKV